MTLSNESKRICKNRESWFQMGMDFFGFGGEKEKKWEGQGPGPLWRVEEKIIIISGFSFGAGSMHGTSETHSCTIQFIYLIFVYFNSRMYFFFNFI